MSLIDLIRGKPQTVATIADVAVASDRGKDANNETVATIASVAVAPPLGTPATATKVVATIEEIIINSSSATAIGAIPATDNPASTAPVRLEDLPPALIDAAVRVCLELHNDGPEAVAAMLEDLRHYPAASWDWLTDHFRRQLLPTTPAVAVVNMAYVPALHESVEYIGRPNRRAGLSGSPLANPFRLNNPSDPTERGRVISQYREWFTQATASPDSPESKELARLRTLAQAGPLKLRCYCHPAACHGDVIAAALTSTEPEPPAITATPATCGGCLHSRPTQHPAILRCAAGVPSGLAIAGRWHTDRHDCSEFTDRQTGATRRPVITTRDKTPTPTRDFSYDPFTD